MKWDAITARRGDPGDFYFTLPDRTWVPPAGRATNDQGFYAGFWSRLLNGAFGLETTADCGDPSGSDFVNQNGRVKESETRRMKAIDQSRLLSCSQNSEEHEYIASETRKRCGCGFCRLFMLLSLDCDVILGRQEFLLVLKGPVQL